MQAADWEACLTDHYLRSDGPYGGSPMAFVDATPEELSAAAGREGWSGVDARASFLGTFQVADVRDWLGGRAVPPRVDGPSPGYFRFLILTCLVVATDEDVGATHDFRDRLGHVLGTEAAFQSVSGVNRLWSALAAWCERRRGAGEPIRKLVLPSPGNMHLIGYAVRIAFPAWRDRAAFARLLATIPPAARRDPYRLVEQLRRPHRWWMVPGPIQQVCKDFARRLAAGDLMLLTHRFWTLVNSIEAVLPDGEGLRARPRWRLEAWFGGYEADEVQFRLLTEGRGQRRVGDEFEIRFEGGFSQLLAHDGDDLPGVLSEALQAGVLILSERQGGRWVYDGAAPSDEDSVVVLARSDVGWPMSMLGTPWRSLDGQWQLSGRLEVDEIRRLRERLGVEIDQSDGLLDLKLEGGVRTGARIYLGRPGFLPFVAASPRSAISVRPLGETTGDLVVQQTAPIWRLQSARPISGRWMLTATEGGLDSDTVVALEDDAPERHDLADQPPNRTFELEREIQEESVGHMVREPGPELPPGLGAAAIDDILEAVYTGPSGGWSESDLVPLIQRRLPDQRLVWDVIRGLAEAGWVDPYVSLAWRARRWRLRSPRLIEVGPQCLLAEGAIGARARRRLAKIVASIGGELRAFGGLSELSPASLLVSGVRASDLSSLVDWPVEHGTRPELQPAPRCWLPENRTVDGRTMVGAWSFELGLFVRQEYSRPTPGEVAIERWSRDRGDDRDVYCVRSRASALMLSSRTAAILEGYRQARRPMFQWASGRLTRSSRSGYLPLPVARALRHGSLTSSGPVESAGGEWSYSYEVSLAGAQRLQALLGSAISVPSAGSGPLWQSNLVRSRRSGQRITYVEFLAGSGARSAPQPR